MKNLFLDRDGIINEVVIRNGRVSSPRTYDEFKIRPEFFEFYKQLEKLPLNIFVISNQPDIARSLMNQKDLDAMTNLMKQHFSFKEIRYCTHDNNDNCSCRKPKTGMILSLLEKYNLYEEDSCIIGDSDKDIDAGKNANLTTIFLKTTYNKIPINKPDFTTISLLDTIRQLQ